MSMILIIPAQAKQRFFREALEQEFYLRKLAMGSGSSLSPSRSETRASLYRG
jgi:hypothetical protein